MYLCEAVFSVLIFIDTRVCLNVYVFVARLLTVDRNNALSLFTIRLTIKIIARANCGITTSRARAGFAAVWASGFGEASHFLFSSVTPPSEGSARDS